MLKSIVAALGFMAVLALVPVQAEEAKNLRVISISGHGEVRVVPDLAVVTVGVTSQAATAREALDANTKSMKALLDTLKKAGIEDRDMATSNFSVSPRIDYNNSGSSSNNQPPKVVGYDVNNMVTITVRKIDDLGELLDVAVSTGSNTINGISFSVSKPDDMLTEARKLAVRDARSKAETYAAAGGFKLGNIVSLSEGTAYQPPMPYMAKAARAEAADAVPIAQGEQSLTIDVSINYEIK
jgi:uncharacterized protein